jgi:Prolyl oligopeptidase, N-terminal beta-propeller domain
MQQFLSRRNFAFGLTAIGAYLTGCKSGIAAANVKMSGAPSPPMAPAALKFEAARSDPYNWLRNREDPRVVGYLNEENAYADAILKPIKPLLDELIAVRHAFHGRNGEIRVAIACRGIRSLQGDGYGARPVHSIRDRSQKALVISSYTINPKSQHSADCRTKGGAASTRCSCARSSLERLMERQILRRYSAASTRSRS